MSFPAGHAMHSILQLNLIRFLDFYLLVFFFASTLRRIGQYRNIVQMVVTGPGRWPRLLKLVREHRTIFMTWATAAPAVLALALSVLQLMASRGVWPDAGRPPFGLTVARLLDNWAVLLVAVPIGLAMFAVDVYGLVVVGDVNRPIMEQYFDQAEYWLRSPAASVVKVVTFGFVNPRRMVAEEVKKALIGASSLLNTTLWWVAVQMGLRLSFGLTLWLTWAFGA